VVEIRGLTLQPDTLSMAASVGAACSDARERDADDGWAVQGGVGFLRGYEDGRALERDSAVCLLPVTDPSSTL